MIELSSLIFNPPHERNIFANRTLNMRSIRAIGYDMDYTLIHYDVRQWEQTAYEHLRGTLLRLELPVEDLRYDPEMMIRGLVIDKQLGNIVKPNRFGYVKRAYHGTKPLDFETQRKVYSRTIVDIREDRWFLLTTLFDLPVACMYAQLVDKLDRNELPQAVGYADLQDQVTSNLDAAYEEGLLKAEVFKDPARYVLEDVETPLALLDQKYSGKKLLLITNSDWGYVKAIMAYSFDQHLPDGMTWRDLFDLVIVSAGKPNFFLQEQPAFELATEAGLLKPVVGSLKEGGIYLGGHARLVEETFGLHGSEMMYVGDHIEADVHAVKSILRWRTALVLPELEDECASMHEFSSRQAELSRVMVDKARLEQEQAQLRLHLLRAKHGYGAESGVSVEKLNIRIDELMDEIFALDRQIKPLAKEAGQMFNPHWGLLTRAGYDKSYLARQLEGYSDIYMSRVSNFLYQTPYAYLRSTRSSLPHDGGIVGGPHAAESM
jgi:HAD superfamily 5'-nucleotidase-like hydrolase